MPTIVLETLIHARAEECFDLVRDKRIQTERPPAIFGEFGIGQTVTFKSKNFGLDQSLTVKVTEFERPTIFADEMTEGSFRSFRHIHEFLFVENGTLMRDTLVWETPFGIIGRIVDKLFLERHLTDLVSTRNAKLKQIAEDRA
ncbi:MAG: SRPBCC family protein [Chloracidobacterium sp.]|nr:SRPBCC family protein [Chloracidobacterium sp.]